MHDDLHIPNPVSPMYADIGGWWLKCDYMFRRFGTPFASDWISKIINGYVYTAAIPAEAGPERRDHRVRRALHPAHARRRQLRRPRSAATSAGRCRTTPRTSCDWWRDRLVPEMKRNFERFDTYDTTREPGRAGRPPRGRDRHARPALVDPLGAQLRPVLRDDGTSTPPSPRSRARGTTRALMGRLQSSTDNRNWDSIEELWKIKESVKNERRRGRRGVRVRDHRGRGDQGAGGHRRGPGVPGQGDRGLPGRVRLQVDVGPRVLVPDLARGPGPDRRGDPRLPRGRLRLPGRDRRRRQGPRGRQGRGAWRASSRGPRPGRCSRRWT